MLWSRALTLGVVSLTLIACVGSQDSTPAMLPSGATTPLPVRPAVTTPGSAPVSAGNPTLVHTAAGSPTPLPHELKGGLLATFRVDEEQFHVWVTNPYSVQIILRVHGGSSTSFVPNGRIRLGPGEGDHNAPWSWHLDPRDMGMDHFAMEECNAAPSEVERSLGYFLDVVERYCPVGAKLVHVAYVPPSK